MATSRKKTNKKQAQVLLHPPTGIVTLVYNFSGWNYTYYDIVLPYLQKGKYELKTTPERSGERAQQTSCPSTVSHTSFYTDTQLHSYFGLMIVF